MPHAPPSAPSPVLRPRSWELPWSTTNPWQIVSLVVGGNRLALPPLEGVPGPDRLPPALLERYAALLQHCWAHTHFDRPSMQGVVEELRCVGGQEGQREAGWRVPPGLGGWLAALHERSPDGAQPDAGTSPAAGASWRSWVEKRLQHDEA